MIGAIGQGRGDLSGLHFQGSSRAGRGRRRKSGATRGLRTAARDGSHDDAGVGRLEAGGGGGFSVSTLPAVAGGGGSVHHLAASSAPATGRTAAGCGPPPFFPPSGPAQRLFQEHPAKNKFPVMTGKGAWNAGSNIAAVQVGRRRPVRQTSRRRRNRAPATSRPASALLGSGTADQVSEFPVRVKDPAPVGATVFPL